MGAVIIELDCIISPSEAFGNDKFDKALTLLSKNDWVNQHLSYNYSAAMTNYPK